MLAFGTYRLKGEVLDIAIGQAIHAMTRNGASQPLIDTAVLYNNGPVVQAALRRYPNAVVGTKLHRGAMVESDLEAELARYGDRLHRALLHRHMPGLAAYMRLVRAKAANKVKQIGVSNYTGAQLLELLRLLKEAAGPNDDGLPLPYAECVPDVVQNEFHPFLRTNVPEVCRAHGITFEAHSVFSFLDEYPASVRVPPGQDDSSAAPLKAAQLALAFALQRGGGHVVFNTANYRHLLENLEPVTLSEDHLTLLDDLKFRVCHARYAGSDTAAFSPEFPHHIDPARAAGFDSCNVEYVRTHIGPAIRDDWAALQAGSVPSPTANGVPRVQHKQPTSVASHMALADAVFVDANGAPLRFYEDEAKNTDARLKKLEHVLRRLRRRLLDHQEDMKLKSKPTSCKLRAIEDPEALPVDIPDPSVLRPFVDLISVTKTLPSTAIRMERGTLFPDGRLDFCKQVSQPIFEDFCQAVLDSGAIKHFLIGNNVALADDAEGKREAALGRLIRESKGIETWYLAGNAIGKDQVKTVADALAANADARYVWLKMNPIQDGSYHLAKMLIKNPRIEVLDLFNTGQCDSGVHALLRGLTEDTNKIDEVSGLKHLYLDINAITDGAAVAATATQLPQLESLSVNVNQLRDAGMKALIDGLLAIDETVRPRLVRFTAGSNGCTDASLPELTKLVRAIPTITVLQLGSYKSTGFFKQQANTFTSQPLLLELARALRENADKSPTPRYNFFGYQHSFASADNADASLELFRELAALELNVNGLQSHTKGNFTTGTTKALSDALNAPTNVQPPPVEFIQSVYRNAM
jgi:diketogulonate reductase-like aldo/keto reductase